MLATGIEVWLDVTPDTRPVDVVPIVRTAEKMHLSYQMHLQQKKNGSSTRISQRGDILSEPNEPMPLGHISVSRNDNDTCTIKIAFRSQDQELGSVDFDCPR